jgi:hypothetical protein
LSNIILNRLLKAQQCSNNGKNIQEEKRQVKEIDRKKEEKLNQTERKKEEKLN